MNRALRHAAVTAAACIASGSAAYAMRDFDTLMIPAVFALALIFGGLCLLGEEN